MLVSIDRASENTARLGNQSQPEYPRVSVVIPVLNDAAGLARCIRSIRANEYPVEQLEIIVADNGSTDGSGDVAAQGGATVVRLPGLSVAALRNRVATVASGEILAFVDADHELSPNWLRSAVEALRQPGVAAVGAAYHPPANATWVQRLYDGFRHHGSEPSDARWLGSGNLAMWKSVFSRVGGFDTSLATCEDVDLCQRVRMTGERLMADERLRSVHHGDPRTLAQLFNSELWRGRDNLVVSLRGPLTWRDLPSMLIPVAMLASLAAIPIAAVGAAFGVPIPLVIAFGVVAGVPAPRALAMVQRQRGYSPLRLVQTYAVASAYDVARALSLVVRKGHRRAD